MNWTKDHQYKTHCRFVNEHGEESRLFRSFFLSALQNASARKSNLCANEDFSRALNVTIEFSKRVLLFDWLFRPPFRLNLSAQSRSLTTASRHKKNDATVICRCNISKVKKTVSREVTKKIKIGLRFFSVRKRKICEKYKKSLNEEMNHY